MLSVEWKFVGAVAGRSARKFYLSALLLIGIAAYGQIVLPSAGNINTVAGYGTAGYSGDGGLATAADLKNPGHLAIDTVGNIYIADQPNCRIRKVTASTGIITTVAGGNGCGFWGDGEAATSAMLNYPNGVAVDAAGNVYIADQSQRVRKVTASTGIISTIAGNGTAGFSGDGGAATSAKLNNPSSVAVDTVGNIYIADTANSVIRKVTASTGIISTIASGQYPADVAVDTIGNIYYADTFNHRIFKMASNGSSGLVVGNGTYGYSGDGGLATSAELSDPFGVAVDAVGNIYISDNNNQRIRKVTASTGTISTIAGNGTTGFSGDGGLATGAELQTPIGVVVDSLGYVYFSDSDNNRIRAINPVKATPTITWANPATITYGTALSATQLNATASVPGTFVYTPAAGTVLSTGTQTLSVTFTPTDVFDYATTTATTTLTVTQATPTISWTTPAAIPYGTALSATQLNATANVSGTFVYTPAAGTVLTTGTHTATVTFTPTDSVDYMAATATVVVTVNKATPTITWVVPLTATSTVAGSFAYSPAVGTALTSGTHTVTATLTPTDTDNYTTATSTATIIVPQ